ncbi:hypothetical protein B0T25DRAFT_123246 [Lasiosphaeria hispida]|uniref:Uncharacterized protein n=1 Tax=Lasiosphaeria hispida TaxID=260671 RepID=A0AAJ0MIC4_9PEZI|nr:hypothetical protein B0T25DRAFT_123246 [Lasiosphaeria hispida]
MPSLPMTASAALTPVLPNMGLPQAEYAFGSDANRIASQPRMFKKHKVLPHPRKDGYPSPVLHDLQRSTPRNYASLEVDTVLSRSASSHGSNPSLRQRTRRLGGGPEPPPTPPAAHSRKSSSSRSVIPSSPTTPPGTATRLARPRPTINDRMPSKVTNDSRTESFRTAPENPYSSEDEDDGKSTLRAIVPSAKTSRSTVRQANGDKKSTPQAVGLGLGLEASTENDLTPRAAAKAFKTFDGEWGEKTGGSASEVEEEWDYNLGRNVMVKKRRPVTTQVNGSKEEVVDDMTVTPTNATKALRMALQESPVVYPARRVVSDRIPAQAAPSNSESSISTDFRRSSMMSTKSTASTVVEAILVGTAPQRRKTLRHVRKQMALRDSRSDLSPTSSAPTSVSAHIDNGPRRRLSSSKLAGEVPRESYASTGTHNSISSRKARREVLKNGGIPVVIVPERRSSVKSSSKEPSLRSTSSRKSKRSQSLGSVPTSQISKSKEHVPIFERPARRSRTLSDSDGSRPGDQRTIDYPPAIPTRSSSLSAPTSRNASRTASLTAESLKAHNAFQAQQATHALQGVHRLLAKLPVQNPHPEDDQKLESQQEVANEAPRTPTVQLEEFRPEILIRRATSIDSRKSRDARHSLAYYDSHDGQSDNEHSLHVDRYGDPFFGRRLSVQNTPFSQASVDTTGTSHAEVSEALAINIYPHQNKSVVIVDHSNKPSESSSLERDRPSEPTTPAIQSPDADEVFPATPPQAFSMDDVDSPLRNPRAPPEPPSLPPAIKFIPATPSGLTPAAEQEKQLGYNYDIPDEKPKRGLSLLQRTLSRRRYSEYGPSPVRAPSLLKRAFSLTRNGRREPDWDSKGKRPGLRRYSTDDRPADEDRLHPHWRPTYADDSEDESEDEWVDERSGGRTYKYPPIDNRPNQPRRSVSLSARVKRTFAILPARDEYDDGRDPLDRRTIRRTPSGNLRVMKFRRSMESMPRIPLYDGRPYAAPNTDSLHNRHLLFWRSPKTSTDSVRRSGFLPTLGNRINIPRRMSERRREKRNQELRRMISSPREVRDGVGDVIRRGSYRETYQEQQRQEQQQQQQQQQQL